MKLTLFKKLSTQLCLAMAAVLLGAGASQAITITMQVGNADPKAIGSVVNNTGVGGQADRELFMLNTLLGVAQNTSALLPAVTGEWYYRSNNYGVLPQATLTGSITTAQPQITFVPTDRVEITLTGLFDYLLAAYDGPNGGAQAWFVGGLPVGTVLNIPANAQPLASVAGNDVGPLIEGRYGMTGWSLFGPTSRNVPDGGATVALLGLALGCLTAGRRYLNKK